MDNLVTLCLLGLFLVIGLMLMSRLMGGMNGGRGNIRPEYDDPDISSRGTFGGRSGGESPRYDSPEIRSRGVFGRARSFFPRSSSRSSSSGGRVDSGNIRSRGSFGRSKR
jgi:hypothetical protein